MQDYKSLGFKSGLEIHQQLSTKKLFCECPSVVNDENEPDIFFTRKLRAVAGELGTVDAAALYEMKKRKLMKYEACSSSACLVELDEEPPHALNEEALKVAIQVSKLFNATLVDEVQFMRKTVVDGSNVSGFQRTALIGFNGVVETTKGPVKIDTICLEEESAKKLSSDESSVTYRLDRLGVPLIEVATDASLKDPEHVAEVASLIGMVLRSTNKVRRGIGSIRQDVNISIKGSARVELKGFQDIRTIVKVIENEVSRLQTVKEHKSEVRKVNADGSSSFLRPMPGAARMYPETDILTFPLTRELLLSIEVPELLSKKSSRLEKEFNINADLAREVVDSEQEFRVLLKKFSKLEPSFIAKVFIELPKEVRSRFNVVPNGTHVEEVLSLVSEHKIMKSSALDVLVLKAENKPLDLSKFQPLDDNKLRNDIRELIKKFPEAKPNVVMGELMKEHRGRIDGKKAMELIQEVLKK